MHSTFCIVSAKMHSSSWIFKKCTFVCTILPVLVKNPDTFFSGIPPRKPGQFALTGHNTKACIYQHRSNPTLRLPLLCSLIWCVACGVWPMLSAAFTPQSQATKMSFSHVTTLKKSSRSIDHGGASAGGYFYAAHPRTTSIHHGD